MQAARKSAVTEPAWRRVSSAEKRVESEFLIGTGDLSKCGSGDGGDLLFF
jgi:hypothetical protein